MIQLSPKQARIYEFILSFTQENGYPPSVREIADAVGLKSPSTVHFHLKSLEEAGVITRGAGKTRAITAVHQVDRPPVAPEARVPVLGNVAAGEPILAEELVEENGRFFQIIVFVPGRQRRLTNDELCWGPAMLASGHPLLFNWFEREYERLKRQYIDSQSLVHRAQTRRQMERIKELQYEIQ